MKKQSAGILVYRRQGPDVEVLIGHPGGPFWAKRDKGAWSIPKGVYEEDEEPLVAARREFEEETGQPTPEGHLVELGAIEQKNNKTVEAWTVEGDIDVSKATSNTFQMEWPPKSGQMQNFPEIDRVEWFSLHEAAQKLNPDQVPLLERLAILLDVTFESPASPSSQQASLF